MSALMCGWGGGSKPGRGDGRGGINPGGVIHALGSGPWVELRGFYTPTPASRLAGQVFQAGCRCVGGTPSGGVTSDQGGC